jgi:hypothetical protein
MTLYTKLPIEPIKLKWDDDFDVNQARTDQGTYSIYTNLIGLKKYALYFEGERIEEAIIDSSDSDKVKQYAQTHYDNLRSVMLGLDPPKVRFHPNHDHFDEGWNACLNAIQHSIDKAIEKHTKQLTKES